MFPPKDPIRDVLRAMTQCEPPEFVRGYSLDALTDMQAQQLQDWACDNCKPSWLTGIGVLDAAEAQVREAVDNANILLATKEPTGE